MEQTIRFFGGMTRCEVAIGHVHEDVRPIDRDIWFDQDIDGRWLVWATARDRTSADRDDDARTGAIVVRNQDAAAFIELLGKLIADPARFYHEPEFFGADATVDPHAQ